MKKLRVLLLTHPQLIPPERREDLTPQEFMAVKTEFDVVKTLKAMGHELLVLGVQYELRPIRDAVDAFRPDIVFNMLEEFHGEVLFDQNIVSYLELLQVPYTGCNPRGMMIARDKAISKKLLAYHGLTIPAFAVFPIGATIKRPAQLQFPLIVKSLTVDSSVGIARTSIVDTDAKLAERVTFIHDRVRTAAIAEQFIEGREIYVSLLGNERVQSFPAWELVAEKKPDHVPLLATRQAKHDLEYQARHGIKFTRAEVTDAQQETLAKVSKQIFKILELSGYGRVDFRLGADGKFYFLEANPNPEIASREEYAASARAVGIEYPELLQRILNLGLRRRLLS